MPVTVKPPTGAMRVFPEPLNQHAFAPFGTVIKNHSGSSSNPTKPQLGLEGAAVPANQGTALKLIDVTKPVNLYDRALSKKAARAVMNMFICSPRELRSENSQSGRLDIEGLFAVNILERHPYTTQTFIPLGLSPSDPDTRYLVVVAPTLPVSKNREVRQPPYPMPEPERKRSLRDILSRARPAPFPENPPPSKGTNSSQSKRRPTRQGLPDLLNLKAFIAKGSQAVTYGAGIWHAPMVALGKKKVEFVVIQYSNGIAEEDCQEVEIAVDAVGQEIVVVIPRVQLDEPGKEERRSKL